MDTRSERLFSSRRNLGGAFGLNKTAISREISTVGKVRIVQVPPRSEGQPSQSKIED